MNSLFSASLTIDAGVLAVPPQNGTAEAAHIYIETLLDWSKLLDETWVAIYMSERASEALFEDGLYPLRNQLKELFVANGIVEYDVNTVASVVERLLQLTPSFETYFSLRDVLTENLTLDPDILCLCSGNCLRSDLARYVVLIAILRGYCGKSIRDHSLVLRNVSDMKVQVRAQIHELEHERNDIVTLPVPPEYFEGEVLVCDDFNGFVLCLNEVAILLNAKDDIGTDTAIRIALYKYRLANGRTPDWDNVPSYQIGHSFRESLSRCNPTLEIANGLLRAIVETLVETNLQATHALRTGTGGNEPQRVRDTDKAKAWRRDIDRDHHFHYWVGVKGCIEIAWLSYPHDDYTIPE